MADPLLAPLGNNGGPTQTVALLDGSPAIGAGIAVTGVTADQRGEPLDSPNPDIGAFQTQGFQLIELTFSVSNQSITYGTSSVTISGTLANGSQALAGETVAVTLDGVRAASAAIGSGRRLLHRPSTVDGLTVPHHRQYMIAHAYTRATGPSPPPPRQHADSRPGDAHHHGGPRASRPTAPTTSLLPTPPAASSSKTQPGRS